MALGKVGNVSMCGPTNNISYNTIRKANLGNNCPMYKQNWKGIYRAPKF